MRIFLITNVTPASENIRGTSALPYHLMIERPKGVEVEIYSYNINKLDEQKIHSVEEELGVQITVLKTPFWIRFLFKKHILPLRIFFRYPLYNYLKLKKKDLLNINLSQPDYIWIYGEEMSRISKQLSTFHRVHTLPDAESLYYYRLLKQSYVVSNDKWYRRLLFMMPKFIRMERDFETSDNIKYHVVGNADANMLRSLNPQINVFFIRHPHYNVCATDHPIKFSEGRIKLLIAGQNNVYMKYGIDVVVACFLEHKNLCDNYEITFLGKWWEGKAALLRKIGYKVNHICFAEDYIEEISKHDVQVTPINIGTGTKGKVLDAMANGLLVIGTNFALENIAVEHKKSCVLYNNQKDLNMVLNDIVYNRSRYEMIAEKGRQAILEFHGRKSVSNAFFSLFFK